MTALPRPQRRRLLLFTLLLGLVLYAWQLGNTGLVDETPPLFAASARAMAETGDWLIPRVNGLPRYDKPPLVYWLMGLIYALPGQEQWNPLGTWASGFPSALAAIGVMLALADTLLRWPQPPFSSRGQGPMAVRPGLTALTAALAFGLSPLMLAWGRTAVSDSLFSGLVALALLLCWQAYANPARPWWLPWPVLGLAVLTKGPVAVVLLGLSLLLFGWLQADVAGLWRRLRPLQGLALTALVALPWYLLALHSEGRPFWDSFFGYHNLQRFTEVVNRHLQPWWFFLPVMLVASLPVSPLLLVGLARAIGPLRRSWCPTQPQLPATSLARFAACWLLAVLLFFTAAATKLPSYWLPATPAAALLIALAAQSAWSGSGGRPWEGWAWGLSLLLVTGLGLSFLLAPLWLPLINDPEMPTLAVELEGSPLVPLVAACWLLAALLGWLCRRRHPPLRLMALQLPLVLFVPTALLPLWSVGDRLRGGPVRQMAAALQRQGRPGEPVAMVGVLKPSLHYYGRRVVIYEGIDVEGPLNLAERLRLERREGQQPSTPDAQPTVLVVIDQTTARAPFWRHLGATEIDRAGVYRLWRLDRRRLEASVAQLRRDGFAPDWQAPRPERY
ncbi:glycosyltransferase family 39 protein [Synechococcus sp. CS-1332]|uniref:ArnT family glycosyltransferase n=1 Tax=Synechococcus sp. CS-1332 TaxID=2847972 RepID=UPI00223BFF66|nr:glycosyltransferase family 39 protein [Synechococcus sp. CS-1332]MCT0208617.1 glycosyltransferase family 39 protein [Synechococcus sp. CS-1332]